jgi:2-enoate reductase
LNTNHKILFEPFKIGKVKLKNRFVMAPMGSGGMVTSENAFSEKAVEYYVERAKGGVGLIITGTVYVENEIEKVVDGVMPCPVTNRVAFMHTAVVLTERVHAYGARIFVQLTAGFGRVLEPGILAGEPISASPVRHFWDDRLMCRELTLKEIGTIIEKTGEAALICKQAGFDGIEIHAVHEGYLLDQFALKYFNKRTDEYGGDLRGRLKFACNIVKTIKKRCGEDFPVTIRYSLKGCIKGFRQGGLPGEEYKELGRDIGEGIDAAKILEEAGYEGFDVDAGTYDSWYWSHPPNYFLNKGVYLKYSELLKQHIKSPVLVAGRMDDPDLASRCILENKTDAIALGRPLLADPEFPNKVLRESIGRIRPCLGCHEGCMHRLITSKPICCSINPAVGREKTYKLLPAANKKRILVIGGGIAGMEFSRVAAKRGHKVNLREKAGQLGGLLVPAGNMKFKEDIHRLLKWYEAELLHEGVSIHLNSEIHEADIKNSDEDIIVLAVGALPNKLLFKGKGRKPVILVEEGLRDKTQIGDKVLIIGGGLVGCEFALELSLEGRKVYIVEILGDILSSGPPIPLMNRTMLIDMLKYQDVTVFTRTKVIEIFKDGVLIERNGVEELLEVTNTVIAVGYHPDNKLVNSLIGGDKETYIIGDAKGVRNIMGAVWDAYEIAQSV